MIGRHATRTIDRSKVVEVLAIEPPSSLTKIEAWSIDSPRPGTVVDTYALLLGGWVLGLDSDVTAIRVSHLGHTLRSVPVTLPRHDVATHYPAVTDGNRCGFQAFVGVLGLPLEFRLDLTAVYETGGEEPLAAIYGTRQPLESTFNGRRQPLMVTMLGRVGSTWLMRLLDAHPDVLIHPPHRGDPYETRVVSYWMHVLKVLAEPANHHQSSPLASFNGNPWWVGHHPFYSMPTISDPRIHNWLGHAYPVRLANFCQESIDAFYQHVAASCAKPHAKYFAEKFHPDHVPWLIWDVYPDTREIFLIRDLRDMLASILAFNQKRGFESFGRESVGSDEEYVARLGRDAFGMEESWKARRSQSYLVRYEDLILSPRDTLRAIFDYLNVDNATETIERVIERASVDDPQMRQHQTAQDAVSSIGRWQRDLSPEVRELCDEVFGQVLEEFGYERSKTT